MNHTHDDLVCDTTGWAVASTHAHRESVAVENLSRQDFPVYCPQILNRIRHARRTSYALRPLFPGYVFVKVQLTHWRPILSTLGVRSLVRCGDELSLISDDFIKALRARELNGAVQRTERTFQIGQKVRVVTGPLDGIVATVIDMNDKERVCVLMDLLKRSVKVHVKESDIQAL